MNNIPIKKITYTYDGFGTDIVSQLNSLSYMTINTDVKETYDSVVVLHVKDKQNSYHFNTLYYVDDTGCGMPLNSLVKLSVETTDNGHETSTQPVIHINDSLTLVDYSTMIADASEQIAAQQQQAIESMNATINAIMSVLEDRSGVLGIGTSDEAQEQYNNAVMYSQQTQEIISKIYNAGTLVYEPVDPAVISQEAEFAG